MSAQKRHVFFSNLPDFEKEAEEEKRLRNTPKAPTFSLDDMEQARQSSHEEGRLLGHEQAKNSIEQQTEILVRSLTDRIHALEINEEKRYEEAINNSLVVTLKALEKLLPTIINVHNDALLRKSLEDFFADHSTKATMTLYVHPAMKESVQKYAPMLSPKLHLDTDEKLSNHQSRLEWEDGVFEFKPDEMIDTILDIIKQYAGGGTESLDVAAKNPHTIDTEEQQNLSESDNTHE